MRILTKYILRNFLDSFLLGFLIFSFIVVLTSQLYQVIKWLVDGVYGLGEVLSYLFFISPMYLNYVIPISIVFGVVSSIGKLSSNFEIIAINSFGISLMEIFKILFKAVILISFSLFIFNEFFAYRFISKALDMYYSASKNLSGSIKNFSIVLNNIDTVSYIFAKEYLGDLGLMNDVFIVMKNSKGKRIEKTIVSQWAKRKNENLWLLYNVFIYDYVNNSSLSVDSIDYVIDFNQNNDRKVHREEMSIWDIYELSKQYRKIGMNDLVNEMYIKINLKFIFPLSGIFLLFLVFNFSLTRIRVGNFLGVVFSVGIAIFYYIFITLFQLLATKTGIVWFLWLPNFISIFLGGFLLFLKNKFTI